LQYVAPIIMLLYLMLMYKTLGGGSWTASLTHSPAECAESADFCSIDSQPLVSWKNFLCIGAFLYVRHNFLLLSYTFCDLSLLH
jgi:hypothetical protein